jgi:hypothetical protein
VHRVVVDRIYGQKGNRVLVLMPYEKSSDTLTITDVRGVSMFEGIHVGDHTGAGLFTGVLELGAEGSRERPSGRRWDRSDIGADTGR